MNIFSTIVPQIINEGRFDQIISKKIPSYISFIKRVPEFGVSIVGLATDLVSQERYSFSNNITSYPLENGTNISDHIINGYLSVAQTFTVFNMPHFERSMIQAATVQKMLLDLRNSQELMTLRTSIGSYPNMAIETLEIERLGLNGTTLTVNIKFREVIYFDLSENKLEVINPITPVKSKNAAYNKASQPTQQKGESIPHQNKIGWKSAITKGREFFTEGFNWIKSLF